MGQSTTCSSRENKSFIRFRWAGDSRTVRYRFGILRTGGVCDERVLQRVRGLLLLFGLPDRENSSRYDRRHLGSSQTRSQRFQLLSVFRTDSGVSIDYIVTEVQIPMKHAGYMKACIACPASFVCMTELVQAIYFEGEIRVFRRLPVVKDLHGVGGVKSLYVNIQGYPLMHCPLGRKKIV